MYDAMPSGYGLNAEAGYSAATRTIETGRDAEAKIFARMIATLKAAARKNEEGDVRPLAEALFRNNQLWTTLASDVALEGNELPVDLRAQIIDLTAFTVRHSNKILQGEETVEALVNINTAVMRGLQGDTGTSDEKGAP